MYWSNFAEEKILNAFRGQTIAAPAKLFAGAFLSNPGDTGGGTEITYDGYERPEITFSVPTEGTQGTTIVNDKDVNFPTSQSMAGDVTYFGFFDAKVGGNMWCYMKVEGDTLTVAPGVSPLIKAGKLNFESRGSFSKVMKERCLNLLRKVNLTGFTPHIALFNGSPEAGGSELSGDNYGRFAVSFSAPEEQGTGQMMIGNSAATSSNTATSNWGTWTHTAITDAATNGAVVAYKQNTTPFIMGETRTATIPKPNAFTILVN